MLRNQLYRRAINYGLGALGTGIASTYKYFKGRNSNRVPRPILAFNPKRTGYSRYLKGGGATRRRVLQAPPNWDDVNVDQKMDLTTFVQPLNVFTVGDSYNQRHGREVTLSTAELALNSFVTQSTGLEQSHHIWIVYDRFPQGTAATFLQVFGSLSTYPLLNEQNRWRFRILYDSKQRKLSSRFDDISATYPTVHDQNYETFYKRIIPLKGMITRYNAGTAGTIADIDFGALYLIGVGSHTAGTTAGRIAGQIRVRFVP